LNLQNITPRQATVTKDGVTVAKSIFLEDAVENLAVKMMRRRLRIVLLLLLRND
jgi:chaperonin GroEL (HSP60 family)